MTTTGLVGRKRGLIHHVVFTTHDELQVLQHATKMQEKYIITVTSTCKLTPESGGGQNMFSKEAQEAGSVLWSAYDNSWRSPRTRTHPLLTQGARQEVKVLFKLASFQEACTHTYTVASSASNFLQQLQKLRETPLLAIHQTSPYKYASLCTTQES